MEIIEAIKKLNNPQFGSLGEYIFEYQFADQKIQRKHSENTDFILNGKRIDVKSTKCLADSRTVPKKYYGKRVIGIDYAFVQFYANIVLCSLDEKILFTINYSIVEDLFHSWKERRHKTKTINVEKISRNFKTNLKNIKKHISKHFIALGYNPRIIYRTNQDEFGKESPGNLIPKVLKNNSVTIFISFNNYEISENNIDEIIAFRDSEAADFPKLRDPKLHIAKVDSSRLDARYKYNSITKLLASFKNE